VTKINRERNARLREILTEEKRRLWNSLRTELFRDQEGLHTQFDIPQDTGEQSMLDLLADTGLAMTGLLREQLTRMDAAESKLADGSYGICEDCGKEIEEERLRIVPYAICCVKCQARRETPAYPPGTKM